MPIEKIADRVSALIQEAAQVERESEQVYLALGRIFPSLAEEMRKSADSGEASIRALLSLSEGASRGSPEGIDSGASFVEEASAFFASLRARDSAFLDRINDAIARLGSLDAVIGRVRADSEEMEIISLNAMTVALKSGSEGKAFSVITDELKRLSGRTISLTESVTANGRFLLDYFARLRGALSDLDSFQKAFFDALDRTLGAGYDELRRGLAEATGFFTTLLEEARGVREPVLRVMNEVQHQDIVRQSLQHVGLSLEEARAADAAGSAGAFVAAVAELSENLVSEILTMLDASVAAFGADLGVVASIVDESERKRLDYLEGMRVAARAGAEASGERSDGAGTGGGTERYLVQKRDVVSMASRLADYVGGLDRSFKDLANLLARFQNIVLASRIEVAKTKALAGVANTVGEMITLTDRIETDVDEAMETTKGFTLLADQAISGYSAEESDSSEDKLRSTLAAVERGIGRLSDSRESMRGAIDRFSLYTREFIGLIGSAGEELERMGSLTERLRSIGAGLAELKSSIRGSLPPGAEAVEPERLRRMVERFTIFTHKKAAGTIGRFAVEEGKDAGEVTLF